MGDMVSKKKTDSTVGLAQSDLPASGTQRKAVSKSATSSARQTKSNASSKTLKAPVPSVPQDEPEVLPFVSVVMPSLNQAPFLEAAIRSVLEQPYDRLELVVADGQSTDGTVELLVHLQREFGARLRWVSQQDSGPAQAINTAISLAQGEIIGWLNSDDLYAEGAVVNAVEHFVNNPWVEMLYGLAEHIDASGHVLNTYPSLPPSTPIEKFSDGSFICQPTVFLRREALDIIGPLDESIKTAFDFDLWLRFFIRFPRQISWIQRIQAYSRLHAACLTQKQRRLVALDGMKVVAKHLTVAPQHWFWTHLDEMCETYPFGPDQEPLLKQLQSFILDSKGFLSAEDLKTVGLQLRTDMRLNLVKPGLMATVQPDAWVSHEVAVKYRWTDKPASAVLLHCVASWPDVGTMTLRVRSPHGEEQVSEIEVPDEFVLRFEVPATDVPGLMMWTVQTDQGFVPAKHDAESTDDRELSFKVLELKLLS